MSITLTTNYLESATARCVPGAYFDRDTKAWVLEDPTPKAAMVALKLYPTLVNEHPELAELRDTLASEVRPFNNAEKHNKPIGAPRLRARLAELG